ncbi:MAG: GlsB/YeaQ/YmgE family stress response membrane protein [Pseudomonadota bacterium]
MFSLVYFLVIGLVAGLLAARVMNVDQPWYMSMLIGMVGAIVGGVLGLIVDIRNIPLLGELVMATLGAILCLWAWSIYSSRKR